MELTNRLVVKEVWWTAREPREQPEGRPGGPVDLRQIGRPPSPFYLFLVLPAFFPVVP